MTLNVPTNTPLHMKIFSHTHIHTNTLKCGLFLSPIYVIKIFVDVL